MELGVSKQAVDLLKKNTKHFNAESFAYLLFIIIIISNKSHASKPVVISLNDVYLLLVILP